MILAFSKAMSKFPGLTVVLIVVFFLVSLVLYLTTGRLKNDEADASTNERAALRWIWMAVYIALSCSGVVAVVLYYHCTGQLDWPYWDGGRRKSCAEEEEEEWPEGGAVEQSAETADV